MKTTLFTMLNKPRIPRLTLMCVNAEGRMLQLRTQPMSFIQGVDFDVFMADTGIGSYFLCIRIECCT